MFYYLTQQYSPLADDSLEPSPETIVNTNRHSTLTRRIQHESQGIVLDDYNS